MGVFCNKMAAEKSKFEGWLAYLRDANVVRRTQEKCGVRVLSEVKTGEEEESRNIQVKPSTTSLVNGAIAKLSVTRPVRRKKARRKQPGIMIETISPPGEIASPPPIDYPDIIVETYPLVDAYFKLATELGYEPFYIIFLGMLHWNIDTTVFRHAVLLWALSMYIGQALKNVFKWPRPSAPPAVRLEMKLKLEYEYGFPSTHATVSTTIPLYLLYIIHSRYESLFFTMIFISILWCTSVSFSRIYLGLHSYLDMIGGVIVSLIMLLILLPLIDHMDHFIFNFKFFPVVAPLIILLLLYMYPVEVAWTSDRGDTAAILGTLLGALLAIHFNGPFPDDLQPGPFPVALPTYQSLGFGLLRFIVGVLLVFPTRFIMKLLCFRFLPAIMPSHGVVEVDKRPLVVLPYKIITYTSMALSAIYIGPRMFEICDISRY